MTEKLPNITEINTTNELLSLMAAYQKSRILFTFVELTIADLLEKENLSARQIGEIVKMHPLAAERFLNACVSVGLLKKEENLYANAAVTKSFLISGKEFYLGGQIERHRKRSAVVWDDLTEKLKIWSYGDDEKAVPETDDQGAEAMKEQHNLALVHGYALAKAFDFSKYKRLLDLGGGSAATSIALCRNHPHLKTVVFDLPENVKIAGEFIEDANLKNRITTVGSDFKKDKLPDDFDAVLHANFMAVADAEDNVKLLKQLHARLPENGVCLLSGWIMDDSHLATQLSVLFCLEDICWNAPDVERSEKIYTEWLTEAGFTEIKCETYLEPAKILYGVKK